MTSHAVTPARCNNAATAAAVPPGSRWMKTLLIVAFLILIVWNLGAGLYYMLVDKGQSKRTVNALTRRIALSVALIIIVLVSIKLGWIEPHGVGA
ncbi:twin transmembrane helix small protein [Lysobacter korlensis]|uniref:Twin transmembrane helix small protein n=1 Tax=Lysobacter korlensis TaxID=553636 RepID=A0ABV6RR61_9GAMM